MSRLFDTPFVFIYASAMASGLLTDEAEAEGKVTIGGEFGGGETTSRFGVRHAYEGMLNVCATTAISRVRFSTIRGEARPSTTAGQGRRARCLRTLSARRHLGAGGGPGRRRSRRAN